MLHKLIFIEDDAATLEAASSFLRRRKYYVVTFCGGAAAIGALQSDQEIGLVVTDLRMPSPDGFDIIRAAGDLSRSNGRALPVIVLTGHATPEDEQKAIALGARCVLRKPIDLRQLMAEIDGIFEPSRRPDTLDS